MPCTGLLNEFTAMSREVFRENLTGVYLHGSLAMGCFDPRWSDLDLLLVTQTLPADGEKLEFLHRLLELDAAAPPKGFELSILTREACASFRYPTPYEFHFSHSWLALAHRDPAEYIRTLHGVDPDLAAHITILHRYGKALYGPPIPEVFAPVPQEAYRQSILLDVENAIEDIARDPVYIVLNLCRVLAFLREGAILSKRDGGEWGLQNLPQSYHDCVRGALAAYCAGTPVTTVPAQLDAFARYMKRSCRNAAAAP